MELIKISSMAIEGPDRIAVKVRVSLDVGLGELQSKLITEDIDPLDPENIQEFMPLLKKHLLMEPFTVDDIRLSNVSQESLVVIVDLSVTVNQRVEDVDGLKAEYEDLLQAKVKALS
jgi:hypothetical protein